MHHVLHEAVASISPDTNENVQRKPYQGSEETERHEGVQVIATGLTEAPAPGSKRYQCQGETDAERFKRHYHHYQCKQYPHGQAPHWSVGQLTLCGPGQARAAQRNWTSHRLSLYHLW